MAFSRLEPFGWKAKLYGFAMIAALILNISRGWKGKHFTAMDMLPDEDERDETAARMRDGRSIFQAFRSIAARRKGKKK